jgi:hypothetical protein
MKSRKEPAPPPPPSPKPAKRRVTIRLQESDAEGMPAGYGDATYELRLSPLRATQLQFLIVTAVKKVRELQRLETRLQKRASKPRRGAH